MGIIIIITIIIIIILYYFYFIYLFFIIYFIFIIVTGRSHLLWKRESRAGRPAVTLSSRSRHARKIEKFDRIFIIIFNILWFF